MNVLFVRSRNKRRSRTAEKIFSNDQRIYVKSVGFSNKSPVKISAKFIKWADLILVMEYEHSKRLTKLYRHLDIPDVEVLGIEDLYDYMDEELISILTEKTNDILNYYV